MTDGLTAESIFERVSALIEQGDDESLRAFLEDLHAADVAECLSNLDEELRSKIFFLLPPRATAEVIVALDEAVRSDVLEDMTDQQVTDVLKELPADDAVDVLDELDDDVADNVVRQLPPEQKATLEPLRQYEEDTAGGIMNPDFVSVPVHSTVADAIDRIRRLTEEQKLDVYYVFVVDAEGKLLGVVPPMSLITAPGHTRIEDLLLHDLFSAQVDDDQEAVKNQFDKYDLAALPVTDASGRMVGVITHDDVLEVAEEEAEEDILAMAGTDAEEFATSSIFRAAFVRARWLLPCLVGTFVTAILVLVLKRGFEADVFALVIAFLTPIAAMGGNAGVQISTVIVRSLATGESMAERFRAAAFREIRIALILGIGAGLMAASGTYLIVQSDFARQQLLAATAGGSAAGGSLAIEMWRVAAAVGSAMSISILFAGTLAMCLPFMFRRMGIDPAIATGPLITTFNDGMSACIYLTVAMTLIT